MSEIAQYKKLARDTYNIVWTLYIAGFVLALITGGLLLPLTFVLVFIGQCYYLPKASKYEKIVKKLEKETNNN